MSKTNQGKKRCFIEEKRESESAKVEDEVRARSTKSGPIHHRL